jgi:hypothetical protein
LFKHVDRGVPWIAAGMKCVCWRDEETWGTQQKKATND